MSQRVMRAVVVVTSSALHDLAGHHFPCCLQKLKLVMSLGTAGFTTCSRASNSTSDGNGSLPGATDSDSGDSLSSGGSTDSNGSTPRAPKMAQMALETRAATAARRLLGYRQAQMATQWKQIERMCRGWCFLQDLLT